MRHLSAHFSASPWLHPCVEKRIANLEQNHFPTSICSFQKVEKQIFFCKFWAELFPPSMYVLLAKKVENRVGNCWQNLFPPSTCSLQYCHQRSWYLGKQWNEVKTFKGSYSYKTRWNLGRCLKSEASSIMAKTLTSKNITMEVQNLCSNCNWQTPG